MRHDELMADHPALIDVQLIDVPIALRGRSTEHIQGLLREIELIVTGQQSGVAMGVPARLLAVTRELETVYAPQIAAAGAVIDSAAERGEAFTQTSYRLPVEARGFAAHVLEVLREVDDFCREGKHLLTVPAPADVAGYRRWSLGEVVAQLDGHPPTPWPAFAAANGL